MKIMRQRTVRLDKALDSLAKIENLLLQLIEDRLRIIDASIRKVKL